jgi:hypothetical protein
MKHTTTVTRWMNGGVEWLLAALRVGGSVGGLVVLTGVLLLPLMAIGQDMPSDESVEALVAATPREGDLDTSFGIGGKILTPIVNGLDA